MSKFIATIFSIVAVVATGCTTVSPIVGKRPNLMLKEAKTVASHSPFGNAVSWSLSPGRYLPVFEDKEHIYYISERPVVRIKPLGDSLGADSGIWFAKQSGAEIKWGIWHLTSPVRIVGFRDPLDDFQEEK